MRRGRNMFAILVAACSLGVQADEVTRATVDELLDSTVHGWLFRLGECPGGQQPDLDDKAWEHVDVGHQWWPHDSECWFRKHLVIPETIRGLSVAGSTIRMRVGVDNEAKAYVDGAFKQQFEWDDGDFVIAEDARPGDTVVVALHGINRPGYGSLYKACLVSSAGADMARDLDILLADYGQLQSYVAYAPATEAERWRAIMHASMQRLDFAAYRAEDQGAFLASVDEARGVLFAGRETFDWNVRRIGEKLELLQAILDDGREAGRQMAYQRVDARVVESFLRFVCDDMADGETGHALRALWTVRFLDTVCNQALEEAKAILDNPCRDVTVPVYTTGPVEIRDGTFQQEGRPIFFTGVGHFGQVRKDVPILTEYGLNIVQIEIGPSSVVLGPDTCDDSRIRSDVLSVLDNAAEHNVMVNVLISPHYFPQWAMERYPKLAECGGFFIRNCIDAPEAGDIYNRFLRVLMPLIAGHPALHSICLSNEPQYQGRCEYSLAMFRKWLAQMHGSIETVNVLYGTAFDSFDAVTFPDSGAPYAWQYDACRFNQDRFLSFHEFLKRLIHSFDPHLPVHAKVMSHAFGDPGKFEVGVDYEDFTLLGMIAGNDCVQTFEGGQHTEYLQRWIDMAANYTFQRSVAPDNPVFNSEDHVISDGDARFIPASHIRTAFWTQAIHGQGAATTWVWERAQEGDFDENILTRANCVRALGRVALDLNRLGPEVQALQQAKPSLAILYAFSSMLPSNDFTNEVLAAFEGAYFADAVCGFVTETQALAGRLADYRVVIAPNTKYVPGDVVDALQAYITSGGVLLASGECFTHDQYGRPRAAALTQTGSGRLLTFDERLTPRAYREIIGNLLDGAGCQRPVRLTGEHGEPIWGVNLRTVEHDGRRLVNLVNYTRRSQSVVLGTGSPIARAIDLFDNTEITFPLTLRPLDPVLLAIECAAGTSQ